MFLPCRPDHDSNDWSDQSMSPTDLHPHGSTHSVDQRPSEYFGRTAKWSTTGTAMLRSHSMTVNGFGHYHAVGAIPIFVESNVVVVPPAW